MKKYMLLIYFLGSSIISFAQLSWLSLPDYPGDGRLGCSSVSINGKGYMGLGLNTGGQGAVDWYEFNPAGNTWTQKASLPAGGRWTCANLVINNKCYVITGSVNGSLSKETWEYDPSTNTWTSMTSFPGTARQNAACFTIGNKGYVGTGYVGSGSVADFYEFDPVANTWTQKTSFPGAERNSGTGFSIDNKGYLGLGTGTNSFANYNDFYEYDPVNDNWTQRASFPITYIDVPTIYSTSSHGYVLCGYYYQNSGITHNPLNTLYTYDPITDEWALKGTFWGLPRGYAGGFALSNDLYICAGTQTNNISPAYMLNDVWKLANGLTLKVEPVSSEVDVDMFPNPVKSILHIGDSNGNVRFEGYRIYDLRGSLTLSGDIDGMGSDVDVSGFSSGMYLIELITSDKTVLDSKFVKE